MWLTGERCEGDGNHNGVYFASKHGLKYFLTDWKKNEDIFSLRKVCHQKQIKKKTYVYVHNHTYIYTCISSILCMLQTLATQSVICRPVALASPGISLKMQNLRPRLSILTRFPSDFLKIGYEREIINFLFYIN